MNYDKLSIGKNPPYEVNVMIEIAANSGPVKYEFDKKTGVLSVDRIMQGSMQYPCNYGFIPHTLSGDCDPVDVLVYTNHSIVPGAVVSVKPIGVLVTEDEKGSDEKVLAVPTEKIDPFFANIKSYEDLPEILIQKINHFFSHYKDLEKGKWVKISGWQGPAAAEKIISEAIQRERK
ncbi:MAG: inorganic diphosphatase [Candidatus Midichloria sp.]|uniref:inorganic diphosphatase n=1 Tax=Hyalomma marginatum TaxID=34627 RepID=A0A8S4C2Q0_9ACAR|nr:inorganic diphosphatase [Hyalomma marginatum]CAG7595025.1 inorganic diphosphatase [Hyalomma marginatum]